jgi:uncharacterized protein (DUF1810 family)
MSMRTQDSVYNLGRFIAAQEPVYKQALAELRAGRKRSHWMWFIFPQIAGLGSSATSQYYAITSLDEARAYLAHPVLGARLRECAQLVLDIEGVSLGDIFGYPDDLKFHSSMTLFAAAAGEESVFTRALENFFGGKSDPLTLARI